MGALNTKIEYPCNCGHDHGKCGRTNTFYLTYSRPVDIGSIFHKRHDEPIEYLGTFKDTGLEALVKLLIGEEVEVCSKQDFIELEIARGKRFKI